MKCWFVIYAANEDVMGGTRAELLIDAYPSKEAFEETDRVTTRVLVITTLEKMIEMVDDTTIINAGTMKRKYDKWVGDFYKAKSKIENK